MPTFNVKDSDFETQVVSADKPVVVDFWADWCGPCKQLSPILEELSDEYAGSIGVAKANLDDNQEWAARLGVRGLPTLLIFKNGELVANKTGAVPKSVLKSWIDDSVA